MYIKHGLNADRQCHSWHLIEIVSEEPRVRQYGVVGKRLHACPRLEAGTWFIKGNVSVRSNAAEEQLDATDTLDLVLELLTFGFEIWCVAIEDVDVIGVYIDVGEEVLVHEAVIAFRVIPWDANIFVLIGSASLCMALSWYIVKQG